MVKKAMTGNLNGEVITTPPFPGKERHFLRAMLARIFHATALSPKGLFEMTEEEGEKAEVKVTEEYPFPSAEELKDPVNWANTYA
jgi:radial spoke head protein 4A